MARAIRRGLMAGAAGTTALTAVTYLDMALRGRPPSRIPERAIEAVADAYRVRIAGNRSSRAHRTTGIATLGGIGIGLAVGVTASLCRAVGVRLPPPLDALATGAAAMTAGNAVPVAAGLTDPRTWSQADWASDAVPHLAYGITTSAVLRETEKALPRQPRTRATKRRRGLLPRSAALGFAAGARSTLGVAGALVAARRAPGRPARRFERGRLAAGALAVGGELVVDKLPMTPSRLQTPSLVARIVSGAGGGAALARQAHARVAGPAVVGGVCAAAGALAGSAWRQAAAARMPPWCAAVAEDAAALLLTSFAARPGEYASPSPPRIGG